VLFQSAEVNDSDTTIFGTAFIVPPPLRASSWRSGVGHQAAIMS
jgi:hypothetical protein